jgi:RimJ/RimL family protein N-acetyltransferase
MIPVPPLTTERLVIRSLTIGDLEDVYRLLDAPASSVVTEPELWQARADWLQWTVLGYEQLASLHQPPLGERAITLRESGQLVGLAGYTPVLDALPQMPALAPAGGTLRGVNSLELGLYYHVAPAWRRRGIAREAAQALIDFAFAEMQLWRIVATTTYDNEGSQAVMRRLGMAILSNPQPEPFHLQIVGVRYNPAVLNPTGR